MFFIALVSAFLAGVSIVIARIINSNLADKIGTFQGTVFNFIVGLLFSSVFLILSNERTNILTINFKSIPWWAYLGGLLGIVIIILSNYITPKISAFYLTLLIFIGQLFLAIIIDYFTLNILSIGKVIGGFLVLAGLSYNLFIDKKQDDNKIITNEIDNGVHI